MNEFERKLTHILIILGRRTDYVFKVTGSKVKVDFAYILASSRSLRRCKWVVGVIDNGDEWRWWGGEKETERQCVCLETV